MQMKSEIPYLLYTQMGKRQRML